MSFGKSALRCLDDRLRVGGRSRGNSGMGKGLRQMLKWAQSLLWGHLEAQTVGKLRILRMSRMGGETGRADARRAREGPEQLKTGSETAKIAKNAKNGPKTAALASGYRNRRSQKPMMSSWMPVEGGKWPLKSRMTRKSAGRRRTPCAGRGSDRPRRGAPQGQGQARAPRNSMSGSAPLLTGQSQGRPRSPRWACSSPGTLWRGRSGSGAAARPDRHRRRRRRIAWDTGGGPGR